MTQEGSGFLPEVLQGMRAEIRCAQDQGIPVVFEQEPPQRVRPRKRIVRKGGHER